MLFQILKKNKIENFNNFLINFFCYFYIVSLFLGTHVESGKSYSFYIALFLSLFKTIKCFLIKKFIFFDKVVIAIIILFFYLLFVDLFFQNFKINNYIISLGLNIIIFIIILDEFKNNVKLRENSFYLLLIILVLISFLVNNNFFSLVSTDNRITFLYWNHNIFSFCLLFPFFFAINQVMMSNKIENYYFFFLIIITLINSIIDSASRFPIYIIFFLLVTSIFYRLNSFKKFFIFASFVYFLFKIFFSKIFTQRIIVHIDSLSKSTSGRSDYIFNVVDSIPENIFFGIGISNLIFKLKNSMPHNIFVEILGTGGLFGLIILLIIGFLICQDIYYRKFSKNKITLILFASLFFLMSIYINVLTEKIWWLFLAFIMSNFNKQTYLFNFQIMKKK